MTLRTTALAAACAAGLLAAPAGASAASSTIIAGPLKVKDYSMTISGTSGSSSVDVSFTRTSGKAMQMHSYSFASGAAVKVKGAKASIKADLGAYGKIDLKAKLGGKRNGTVPAGCTGSAGKTRTGTLKGTFKLAADTTYFNTVATSKLKAMVLRAGKLECGGGSGGTPKAPTMLMATKQDGGAMLSFYATKAADGSVNQQAMRMDDDAVTAPASIMHMITAPGGAAAFAPAADLSSATGSAVAPFFSGAFSFASDFASGTMSTGTLAGDFAAKFDSIGSQAIGGDAMIMQGQ
jgi:hypothetical protein